MISPAKLLTGLPDGLRLPLISAYAEIVKNYAERRWEPSELNGGKLCEIVYSIVDGAISGSFPPAPIKPPRFIDACRAIEQRPSNSSLVGDRSLRVLIPRLLPYVYEIRNNRNVGHVGGDVDPNFSDATAILSAANWLMAELVRIFHCVSLADAQSAVDLLVERRHPIIWENGDVKRVLDPDMPTPDQVLVLLYSSKDWVPEEGLRNWTEYKNPSHFRNRVLSSQHRKRLIEYDLIKGRARLTPRGVRDVEDRILPRYEPN